MADFSGARDMVAALVGGDAIEQGAYNAAGERLTRERSARALMEQRISKAAQERLAADAMNNLLSSVPAGRDRDILMSKLGTSFSGLQRGIGYEQQNLARSAAIDALVGGEEAGVVNQLTGIASDKMVTPNNLAVERQAAAQAAQDEAAAELSRARASVEPSRADSFDALADERSTSADYNRARTENPERFRASGGGGGSDMPGATTLALYFPFDSTGKQPELREFLTWRAQQAEIDPNYRNFDYAHRAWLDGKRAATAATTETAVAPTPQTPPEQPAPIEAPETEQPAGYGNQADAEALIAAAERAISRGLDRSAVEARLKEQLEKLGFTYASQ